MARDAPTEIEHGRGAFRKDVVGRLILAFAHLFEQLVRVVHERGQLLLVDHDVRLQNLLILQQLRVLKRRFWLQVREEASGVQRGVIF